MKRYIRINSRDNVVVATAADGLHKGENIEAGGITATVAEDIAYGHKAALTAIAAGEKVVKYGNPIGIATADIAPGEHVHSHNLRTALGDNEEYSYDKAEPVAADTPAAAPLTFMGYRRSDGSAGVRNELWIVPTVACVNGTAERIAECFRQEYGTEGIDDVCVAAHPYGCSQLGEDHANTRRVLAALARHPNAGGVLVLGLGCENNQAEGVRAEMGDYDPARVRFLVAQEVDDETAEGVRLCAELAEAMRGDRREQMSASELRVGLKCGGSDGLSGITANPLAGLFADLLTAQGGTAVLTEVPEMFGAERLLMARAADRGVFGRMVVLINGFKDYFRQYGMPVYENPSPGNKAGGITTLEEKSLGCVQKGGSGTVADVLGYGERLRRRGLNIVRAPGNDPVAATALAAAGCQIVLFTTGRGTPYGSIVPTLKIATNTALAGKKPGWIDFNAGTLVEDQTPEQALAALVAKVLAVASGEKTKNEEGGAKEIAIFKNGVTL